VCVCARPSVHTCVCVCMHACVRIYLFIYLLWLSKACHLTETFRVRLLMCYCVLFKGLNIQKVPWNVDLSTDACQLSMYTGVMNALSPSELCCVHPITGEPVINFIFHHLFAISQRYFIYSFCYFSES